MNWMDKHWQYKDYDLEFCAKALKWLDEGKTPYYSCWW